MGDNCFKFSQNVLNYDCFYLLKVRCINSRLGRIVYLHNRRLWISNLFVIQIIFSDLFARLGCHVWNINEVRVSMLVFLEEI